MKSIATDESDLHFTFYKIGNAMGCVLWNKLGSDTEVTSSEIGPNGTKIGTPTYAAAKFGNGIDISSPANRARFDVPVGDKFTIEFWAKMNFNFSDIPGSGDYHVMFDGNWGPYTCSEIGFRNNTYDGQLYWDFTNSTGGGDCVGDFTNTVDFKTGDDSAPLNDSTASGHKIRAWENGVELTWLWGSDTVISSNILPLNQVIPHNQQMLF